jgi:hypothetical protein
MGPTRKAIEDLRQRLGEEILHAQSDAIVEGEEDQAAVAGPRLERVMENLRADRLALWEAVMILADAIDNAIRDRLPTSSACRSGLADPPLRRTSTRGSEAFCDLRATPR